MLNRRVIIAGLAASTFPVKSKAESKFPPKLLEFKTGKTIPTIGMGTWQTFSINPKGEALSRRRKVLKEFYKACLLYTSPSPRDQRGSRMPYSA